VVSSIILDKQHFCGHPYGAQNVKTIKSAESNLLKEKKVFASSYVLQQAVSY